MARSHPVTPDHPAIVYKIVLLGLKTHVWSTLYDLCMLTFGPCRPCPGGPVGPGDPGLPMLPCFVHRQIINTNQKGKDLLVLG